MAAQSESRTVLRIDWERDSPEEPFAAASHLTVNFDEDNFYIRYYQIVPPIRLPDEDHAPESVTATQIAKVAVPVSRMAAMIRALSENAAQYEERLGRSIGLEEDEYGSADAESE